MKRLLIYSLISIILFIYTMTLPMTSFALSSVTWTTKGDFDNNASSVSTPTFKNDVEITGNLPGDNSSIALTAQYGLLGSNLAVANDYQGSPAITYNSNTNQFLIAWTDYRNNGSTSSDIYARIANPDGSLVGSEIVISNAANDQSMPKIAFNGSSNQFLVVWEDNRNLSSTSTDIYAQKINSNGTLDGSNFIVAAATHWQNSASIAYSSLSDQFIVVWQDYRNNIASGSDIWAQKINSEGNLQGVNYIVSDGPSYQYNPSISYNSASGEFMITWEDQRNWAITELDIYAQKLNDEGGREGGNFPISNATGWQHNSSIIYNPISDRFIVVWQDGRNGAITSSDIYGQKINSNGTLEEENYVVHNTLGSESHPVISYDSLLKQFMIIWAEYVYNEANDSEISRIYAQMTDVNGSLIGSNYSVSPANAYYQAPSIAYNSNADQFMVVFEDYNSTYSDIYSQRLGKKYASNGTLTGLKINATNKVKWQSIGWNKQTPTNTLIKFKTRAADTEVGLASAAWSGFLLASSSLITSPDSQWLEVQAILETTDVEVTPELNDFTINNDAIIPSGNQPAPNPGGFTPPQQQVGIQGTNLTLKITPSTIIAGKGATIKGQLKDSNGQPVITKEVEIKQKIQKVTKKKVKGKLKVTKKWIWQVIAKVNTNSKGQFIKKIKPKQTTLYQATFSGDTSYSAKSSNIAKVTVKKKKKKK